MTDGLVKHEGVVSINDVPLHPSTAANSSMRTVLSVIPCAFHIHTPVQSPLHTHDHTQRHTLPAEFKPSKSQPHAAHVHIHLLAPTVLHGKILAASILLCGKTQRREINLVQRSMMVLSFPRVFRASAVRG